MSNTKSNKTEYGHKKNPGRYWRTSQGF